jgi:membrane associated rhomboid family serine protease
MRRWWQSQRLLVTWVIIATTVAAFIVIAARDGSMTAGSAHQALALRGFEVHDGEWWRLLSHSLVHYGPIHIAFNMLILYQVGVVLEPAAGHLRFALLYVVSVLGGAAGALIADPHVYTGGASGGVFGVAAAATLALHRQGASFSQTGFGPLLVINLALGFVLSGVSVGGHIGGLIAGVVAAEAMLQARRAQQPALGVLGAVAVGAVSVVVALSAAAR